MLRNLSVLILCVSLFMSCKNETKTEKDSVTVEDASLKSYDQNDGLITMRGDFIYFDDAAVLQTSNDIYGVVIDENMHKLNEQVQQFKTEDTDMVPVTVRVKKIAKPEGEEGWPFRVEIKEILKVEAPDPNKEDVIKLEN
jgi:hypothetical protein